MRYKGLDLNLLMALEALIDERSVSRAADRLHLSQPAMSAALGRLRAFFGDPILGAHGKRMIPTAHALRLRPMLRELLSSVDALVSESIEFDPGQSQRHFRLGLSDYLATVILNPLVTRLERAAPGVTVEVTPPFDGQLAMLDRGEIDVLVTPEEHLSPVHPAQLLLEEKYVVAGWSGNSLLTQPLSEAAFYGAGHVAVEIGLSRRSFAETALRARGDTRKIEMTVGSFLLAPELVINSARLTVMQERLAMLFASRIPLCFVPMPFAFPVMREMAQVNRARAGDAGLKWLVEQLHQVANHEKN